MRNLWLVAPLGLMLAIGGCGSDPINPDTGPLDTGPADTGPDTRPDAGRDTGDDTDMVTPPDMPDDKVGPDLPDLPPPPPVGDACTVDADCPNGFCLEEGGAGFLGGYCTAVCNPAGAKTCGEGSVCVPTPGNPNAPGICALVCEDAAGCRTGYVCTARAGLLVVPDGLMACASGTADAVLGDACTGNFECAPGDFCIKNADVPNGYCSRGCDPAVATPCGTDGECVPNTGPGATGGTCAALCTQDTDCRAEYACVGFFGGNTTTGTVCSPGSRTAAIGDACTVSNNCPAGRSFCGTEEAFGFPGGSCLSPCDPDTLNSCGTDALCVALPNNPANPLGGGCAPRCTVPTDCRAGYVCGLAFGGEVASATVCAPGTVGARTGDACEDAGDCVPGFGFCAEGSGLPGNYCSQPCDVDRPCSVGEECVDFTPGTPTNSICLLSCTTNTDCRAGYTCGGGFNGVATTGSVCRPGTDAAVEIGHNCEDGGDCTAGTQFCIVAEGGFTGGYCAANCDPRTPNACGTGNTCLPNDMTNPAVGLCVAACTNDADCADRRDASTGDYGCDDRLTGSLICLPYAPTAAVGDPCTGLGTCPLGFFCASEPDSQGFVGGYCTANCDPTDSADQCGAGGTCIALNPQMATRGNCLQDCEADSECREGYFCRRLDAAGNRGCFP